MGTVWAFCALLYYVHLLAAQNNAFNAEEICRPIDGTPFHAQCLLSSVVKQKGFIPKHLRPPWLSSTLFKDNKLSSEVKESENGCFSCYRGTKASNGKIQDEDYCACVYKGQAPNDGFSKIIGTFDGLNCLQDLYKMALMPKCGNRYYDQAKHCAMVHFYDNEPEKEPNGDESKRTLVLLDGCIKTETAQNCTANVQIAYERTGSSFFYGNCNAEKKTVFESSIEITALESPFTFPVEFQHRFCSSLFGTANIDNTFYGITVTISGNCGTKSFKLPQLEFEKGRVQEMRGLQLDLGAKAVQWRDPYGGHLYSTHHQLIWQPTELKSINANGKVNAGDAYPQTAVMERKNHNGMNSTEFRHYGRKMVDYVADYLETIEKRRVFPDIKPGYLRNLLPMDAPIQPENFDQILQDTESYIMPGVTHWQHPRFHAYFPAGNSFPSIMADMLSDAIGCMGFSWAACPALTELETHMLHWFGKMLGLPAFFLPFSENSIGGGVIQTSASEAILDAMLAARSDKIKQLKQDSNETDGVLLDKLVAYCPKEAHSSVEKAALLSMVRLCVLETDSSFRLRGETLQKAMDKDRKKGLIPFFVSITLGTTSCCSFDVLSEIGPVATKNNIWLHVDAAYAGSAMICPEFRYLMEGIEHAMSFNTNPNKWMLIAFDCSAMWIKNSSKLNQAMNVDPYYLKHSFNGTIDYRHWGIPLSRRFRALKLWYTIRTYGVEGLQRYIRGHVRLAKYFESMMSADPTFEIVGNVTMALVCFRIKDGSEEMNRDLLKELNLSGQIHVIAASPGNRTTIRFCVNKEDANEQDVLFAFKLIKKTAVKVLESNAANSSSLVTVS
ncbi:hypothetical protein niasHT_013955 [Heterodera trifolii]|uniref:Aromatic-L-amino-acid decarboxylase n=1 Tax=Heterodera trifolii TaxID=157864 RepID=A0ABD2L1S5_9BILA